MLGNLSRTLRLGLVLVPFSLTLQGCDFVETLLRDILEGVLQRCGNVGSDGNYPPLTVTTTEDLRDQYCTAASCSLQGAIFTNNYCGGRRTIILTKDAEYVVTGSEVTEETGGRAFPAIRNHLTITGNGATIRASYPGPEAAFRLFYTLPPAEFILDNVTLANGLARKRGASPRPFDHHANYGGAIYNRGRLTLRNVRFIDNHAQTRGGAIYNRGVLVTESSSIRNSNSSALYNEEGAAATINTTSFSNNQNAGLDGRGGAIWSFGTLDVNQSEFVDNRAALNGGAISSYFTMSISRSTIANNAATGDAGGIHLIAPGTTSFRVTIVGSTLSSNTGSIGAAIIASGAVTVELRDVTIAANTATSPGGGAINISSGASWTIGNTLLVENPGGNCGIAGSITASSSNLSSDASCEAAARMVTGLIVEGLADNGGPTRTHSLPVGSPAIDSGTRCEATDQRGQPRPRDGNGDGVSACDVGAFEAPR